MNAMCSLIIDSTSSQDTLPGIPLQEQPVLPACGAEESDKHEYHDAHPGVVDGMTDSASTEQDYTIITGDET